MSASEDMSDLKQEQRRLKNRIAAKKYYYLNRDKKLAYFRRYNSTKRKRGGTARLTQYKSAAKFRELDFKLSPDEFNALLTLNCHYCDKAAANGVDRIDSSKGYLSYNVVPCCSICNRMKMDLPYNQFIEHIDAINKHMHSPRPLNQININALT